MSSMAEVVISEVFKRLIQQGLGWKWSETHNSKNHGRRSYKRWGKPGLREKSAFSENATSEKQDLAPRADSRAAKRKRGKSTLNYKEEALRLENRNLEWLIKQGVNYEYLNFYRSLLPNVKQLPPTKKVIFEVTVPKHGGRWDRCTASCLSFINGPNRNSSDHSRLIGSS